MPDYLGLLCEQLWQEPVQFGASEHFWSQAIIAEVYTLNALLFFAVGSKKDPQFQQRSDSSSGGGGGAATFVDQEGAA